MMQEEMESRLSKRMVNVCLVLKPPNLTVFKYLSILKTVFLKFLSGNSVIYGVISKSVSVLMNLFSEEEPNWLASMTG